MSSRDKASENRAINTRQVRLICRKATGRALLNEIAAQLDPNRLHILSPQMIHGPDMRCLGIFALEGRSDGYQTFIDVPLSVFDKLPKVPEVLAA